MYCPGLQKETDPEQQIMRSRWLLLLFLTVATFLGLASCHTVVAKCGQDFDYCQCLHNRTRSGRAIIISCDFQIKGKEEAVLLTDELIPFRNWGLVSIYVRVMNAGSLEVTSAFLEQWLAVPSAALDLWHCGVLNLQAAPLRRRFYTSFSTFAGIGIIGCSIPKIPSKFLRDRMGAGLRIKKSVIGVMSRGLLHNIRQMRYLVLEDSVVDSVEGSVAAEGHMNLGQRVGHSWNGVIISNTVIRTVAAGAFNLTHQGKEAESTCKVEVTNCQLGAVGTGALTVAGDIAVTIKGNYFQRLEKEAFKINVRDELKFEENVAKSLDESALKGLICHNFTSLEKNTVHWETMPNKPNNSAIPFHMSCGNPQVFMVVSRAQPQTVKVTGTATWVLLAILLVVMVGGSLHWHKLRQKKCEYRKGNTFHFFNGLKSSQENLSSRPELNMMTEVSVEGVSNPLYDRAEPSSSL